MNKLKGDAAVNAEDLSNDFDDFHVEMNCQVVPSELIISDDSSDDSSEDSDAMNEEEQRMFDLINLKVF